MPPSAWLPPKPGFIFCHIRWKGTGVKSPANIFPTLSRHPQISEKVWAWVSRSTSFANVPSPVPVTVNRNKVNKLCTLAVLSPVSVMRGVRQNMYVPIRMAIEWTCNLCFRFYSRLYLSGHLSGGKQISSLTYSTRLSATTLGANSGHVFELLFWESSKRRTPVGLRKYIQAWE